MWFRIEPNAMEAVPACSSAWSFSLAVTAEARATWHRCVRYWLLPALLIAVAVLLEEQWDGWIAGTSLKVGIRDLVGQAPAGLWWLAITGAPAWLCSDLLSIRCPANPNPHREWHPREFLARAVGRLLPVLPILLGWSLSLLVPECWRLARAESPLTAWLSCAALLPFIYSAALLAAALAALLSATARRPRRWTVLLPAAVGSIALSLLVLALCAGRLSIPATGGALFLLSLVPSLLTALIAWERYRRHPNTAAEIPSPRPVTP